MDNLVIVWTLGAACQPDKTHYPLLISICCEVEERKISTPYRLTEEELNLVITGCASNEALQEVGLYVQQEEMNLRYVASLLDTCTTDYTVHDVVKLYEMYKESLLLAPATAMNAKPFCPCREVCCEYAVRPVTGLTDMELNRLIYSDFQNDLSMNIGKYTWLFLHYAPGISLLDVIDLKKEDVHKTKIWYRSGTRNSLLFMNKNKKMERVISELEELQHDDVFVFPFNGAPTITNEGICEKLKWYNSCMSKVAQVMGFLFC
ncbi:hypothetical protein [Bacteroides graminisolvens]|uniref:hypothetical protein n=1 Tax=Bacteroides graminisolvens TaxID=477666 RepID=UPI0029C8B342|nr:hypothetical protein [Bacteroides graminisolvens]